MKRYGRLYNTICSFKNLLKASRKAQKGKRFKLSTSRFNLELEKELMVLQAALQSQTYRPGEYKQFYIHDPKKRLISAAPYSDRVVQHALCSVIEPILERSLIYDCYACRKNKGTLKAVDRFTEFSRKNKYVLKCDVKGYFATIDHDVLYKLILARIKDQKALWLIKLIIDSTPNPGIPIGNLTSQIFANLYLDRLDHFIKESLKCGYYIRYMDDLVIFDDDRDRLNIIGGHIKSCLKELRLELHPTKCQIYSTEKGANFLGYKVYPYYRLVIKKNIKRFKQRGKKYLKLARKGIIDSNKIIGFLQSWLGYAIHANSFNLRRRLLLRFNAQGISL